MPAPKSAPLGEWPPNGLLRNSRFQRIRQGPSSKPLKEEALSSGSQKQGVARGHLQNSDYSHATKGPRFARPFRVGT